MSVTNRLLAIVLAIVLLLAAGVGALLAVSAVGDLFTNQVGVLRGVGEFVAGFIMAIFAGMLGFVYARQALKPRAPSAAA